MSNITPDPHDDPHENIRRNKKGKGACMNLDIKVQGMILTMVEKLKRAYQPNKIVLFGSYAYGQPDRDSDIDLLIIKDTPDRPIDRRVAVSRIVSDPQRLVPFEPLVLTPQELQERLAAGDLFLEEILTKGEVLYEA